MEDFHFLPCNLTRSLLPTILSPSPSLLFAEPVQAPRRSTIWEFDLLPAIVWEMPPHRVNEACQELAPAIMAVPGSFLPPSPPRAPPSHVDIVIDKFVWAGYFAYLKRINFFPNNILVLSFKKGLIEKKELLPLRVALTNFPLSCSMNLSKFVKAHCWPSMSKGSKFYWKCYNLLMLFNICHICLSNIKAFDARKIKCSAIKGKRTSLRVTQNQKPRNATSFSKKRDPLPTC